MSKTSKKGNLKDLEKLFSGFYLKNELDENGLIKAAQCKQLSVGALLNWFFQRTII